MPRGGPRPGAGRPKGSRCSVERGPLPGDILRAAAASDLEPLDYMLTVMRNPEADPLRRDRMAVAAAPYRHQKLADVPIGKKEAANTAAKNPSRDTALGELIARRQGDEALN